MPSRIGLLGTPADKAKLARLARLLTDGGFPAEVDPRGPRSTRPLDPGRAYVVCWTAAALGRDGARVRECAIELKSRGDYVGALLEHVTPPDGVRAADEVDLAAALTGRRPQMPSGVIEALRARLPPIAADDVGAGGSAVARTLAQLAGTLRRISGRLRAVGIVSTMTFLVGIFGLYSNWIGAQDALCRGDLLQPLCRAIGAGHLPTGAEEKEWRAIVRGSSCEAFDRYLARYGPSAHFAREAEHRLERAKDVAVARSMLFPLSVPLEESPARTHAAAQASTATRAGQEARTFCASHAQSFAGEAAPGEFVPAAAPRCDGGPGAYLCRTRGQAKCAFLVMGEARTCPPGVGS